MRKNKMAIAELNNIDSKLISMYENQVTTNVTSASSDYQDKSQMLFEQMQMIAFNNKTYFFTPTRDNHNAA